MIVIGPPAFGFLGCAFTTWTAFTLAAFLPAFAPSASTTLVSGFVLAIDPPALSITSASCAFDGLVTPLSTWNAYPPKHLPAAARLPHIMLLGHRFGRRRKIA